MHIKRLASALLIVLSALSLSLSAQRPTPPSSATRTAAPARRLTPPLVVLIVVDQFRADYVQRYGHMWTKGLRRLVDTGAYFPQAQYPYAVTLTCAGHATIGTGAYPRTHGMIANSWYDRAQKKSVTCTEDPGIEPIAYGGLTGKEHHGPKWLRTNTFADELRNQQTIAPKITSISFKPRSAIGMAGHGGDLVLWAEDNGAWATSSAYAKSARPDVDAAAAAHAITAQFGRTWDRMLPASAYAFADDEPGEQRGLVVFPHVLTGPNNKADQAFLTVWERSPFIDEPLADYAIAFSNEFGTGAGTDLLAVSFSGLDYVGHYYGPKSHEVQDTLVRLDAQLGRLFDTLDKRLGAGKYVVALSADHGVAPVPEQVSAMGLDAGRITAASVTKAITDAWKPFATDDVSPIANNNGTDLYFTPAALATLHANHAAKYAVTEAALAVPGIEYAYWGDDLAQGQSGDDAIKRAAILSYVPGRSADLLLIPKPYWMVGSALAATHGTPYAYDQRVPVFLMGFGVKPGHYLTAASPADIAPTLAFLTGITLPRAEGRALTEAVQR